jgi:hypothetical protein
VNRDFGPDETWPTHSKAHWRMPLQQARRAGWTLHFINAPHTWGVVECPATDTADKHTFKVDSTATGSAFFATEASKLVTRRCRHGSATGAGKVQDRVARCEGLLARAEDLLGIAERKLETIEAHQATWGTVFDLDAQSEQLRLQIETAEATLGEALANASNGDDSLGSEEVAVLEAELVAVETQLEHELVVAAALGDPPAADSVEESLVGATADVGEAEKVAGALSKGRPSLAQPLAGRAALARARIRELRARLITFEER